MRCFPTITEAGTKTRKEKRKRTTTIWPDPDPSGSSSLLRQLQLQHFAFRGEDDLIPMRRRVRRWGRVMPAPMVRQMPSEARMMAVLRLTVTVVIRRSILLCVHGSGNRSRRLGEQVPMDRRCLAMRSTRMRRGTTCRIFGPGMICMRAPVSTCRTSMKVGSKAST